MTTSTTPQMKLDLTMRANGVSYRLRPLKTIDAYQVTRLLLFVTAAANSKGYALDDAFAEVYAETKEHWEKIG